MTPMSHCKLMVLAVFVLAAATAGPSQEPAHRRDEVRPLLVDMRHSHRSTQQLATLFRVGDEKIEGTQEWALVLLKRS